MKKIINIALGLFILSGCVTKQNQAINLQDAELMPESTALAYTRIKIPNFNPNEVTIYGFSNASQTCRESKKNIPINKLNSAAYANNRYSRNTLFIRSDFSELSTCTQGIFIKDISKQDSERLVLALNALGASIPNIIILLD